MRVLLLAVVLWLLTRKLAYGTPANPVGGTVITVAYAVANILDPIRWLRAMTGGSDPPGSNYWLRSTSTTAVVWANRVTEVLAALGYTPVNKAGDSMSGPLTLPAPVSLNAAGTVGISSTSPNSLVTAGGISASGTIATSANLSATSGTVSGSRLSAGVATGTAPLTVTSTTKVANLNADLFDDHDSAFFATAAALTAETNARTAADAAIAAVPSGLIAAFPNAATIAPGWSRFTNGNGRLLVGAGTVAGQTFVEGASAGSSWAHLHGVSLTAASAGGGAVQGGGSSSASPSDHVHGVSGNTADATWIPPSFTVVWAIKS